MEDSKALNEFDGAESAIELAAQATAKAKDNSRRVDAKADDFCGPETPAMTLARKRTPKSFTDKVYAQGFPDVTRKGVPSDTIENMQYILDAYGIDVRYNQMARAIAMTMDGSQYTDDNRETSQLAQLRSLCSRNNAPVTSIAEYLLEIADRNAFHPVRNWIESKKWDGTSRLNEFFETVIVDEEYTDIRNKLIFRWLVSAVAALYHDGLFRAHGVLVFTGMQGGGKTTWFSNLAPARLNAVLEGKSMDTHDKDAVITMISHWLVEMGEIDGSFSKNQIQRLKAFVTLPSDRMRRPYAKADSDFRRRTVFGASANVREYLVDDTGNRRWWTIPTNDLNFEHKVDMQQLWAEVLTIFRTPYNAIGPVEQEFSHQPWHLLPREMALLNEHNESFQASDPIEELITSCFQWSVPKDQWVYRYNASKVLKKLELPVNKGNTNKASAVLRKLTGGYADKGTKTFGMPAYDDSLKGVEPDFTV
jgi:putative DNA primase/helicase